MIIIIILFVLIFVAIIIGAYLDFNGGNSWIKEDGTIIEWDGQGNCNILEPDGTLHQLKDGEWTKIKNEL